MNQEWFSDIPELETEHYLLRGMRIDDASTLFEFMSDKDTMKFITPHPVKSVEVLEENILSSIKNFKMKKEIPWVIIDKENQSLVGMFRFHKLHLWHQKTELGAVIRKEYQQKGVMTEVFERMIPYGFTNLKLNRIVGDIFAGNKGSQRLLVKYGFQKDGVLRQTDFDGKDFHDTFVYSLLKDEFENGWKHVGK